MLAYQFELGEMIKLAAVQFKRPRYFPGGFFLLDEIPRPCTFSFLRIFTSGDTWGT